MLPLHWWSLQCFRRWSTLSLQEADADVTWRRSTPDTERLSSNLTWLSGVKHTTQLHLWPNSWKPHSPTPPPPQLWGNRVKLFFTFCVFLPCHEGQDGFGVVVRLLLAGRPRVLAVVGQLVHPAQVTDGVTGGEGEEEENGEGLLACWLESNC